MDKEKVRFTIKLLLNTNIDLEKMQQSVTNPLTEEEIELLLNTAFQCEDCGYWTSKELFHIRDTKNMCWLCATDYDSRLKKIK